MKQKAQDSITAAWAFFNQQKLIKSLLTYFSIKLPFLLQRYKRKW